MAHELDWLRKLGDRDLIDELSRPRSESVESHNTHANVQSEALGRVLYKLNEQFKYQRDKDLRDAQQAIRDIVR